MQNLDLQIAVSDATLALIDSLRVGRSREEVVRQLLELGLCEMLEATARTHRDATINSFSGTTSDLKVARNNLLTVKEPVSKEPEGDEQDAATVRRYEAIQTITPRSARG